MQPGPEAGAEFEPGGLPLGEPLTQTMLEAPSSATETVPKQK